RTKGGKVDPTLGFERRWVIYSGVAEASTVPPSWHGWLHHTVDVPPTQEEVTPQPWWKPHRPNLTGTPGAHRPTGSTLAHGRRPPPVCPAADNSNNNSSSSIRNIRKTTAIRNATTRRRSSRLIRRRRMSRPVPRATSSRSRCRRLVVSRRSREDNSRAYLERV